MKIFENFATFYKKVCNINESAEYKYYFFSIDSGDKKGEVLIDFENQEHIDLIKALANMKHVIEDEGELATAYIKVLKRKLDAAGFSNVNISRFGGPDLSIRGNNNKGGKLSGTYGWVDASEVLKNIK